MANISRFPLVSRTHLVSFGTPRQSVVSSTFGLWPKSKHDSADNQAVRGMMQYWQVNIIILNQGSEVILEKLQSAKSGFISAWIQCYKYLLYLRTSRLCSKARIHMTYISPSPQVWINVQVEVVNRSRATMTDRLTILCLIGKLWRDTKLQSVNHSLRPVKGAFLYTKLHLFPRFQHIYGHLNNPLEIKAHRTCHKSNKLMPFHIRFILDQQLCNCFRHATLPHCHHCTELLTGMEYVHWNIVRSP